MNLRVHNSTSRESAFTMVEIAICLAVIGLALVSIIGVLPIGMNVQRQNREETIINQDATVLLESICNGVRSSGFDLTNYVYGISIYQTAFSFGGKQGETTVYNYSLTGATSQVLPSPAVNQLPEFTGITNNARIIGLLSTPEFLFQPASLANGSGKPVADYLYPTNNVLSAAPNCTTFSNHIYAYVHAMSGPAAEKPPQNNSILVGDSFSYRVLVVNAPPALATNSLAQTDAYQQELAANYHEVRLTFSWPLRPNGVVSSDGPLPQTQRTGVSGTVLDVLDNGQNLYYYQKGSYSVPP